MLTTLPLSNLHYKPKFSDIGCYAKFHMLSFTDYTSSEFQNNTLWDTIQHAGFVMTKRSMNMILDVPDTMAFLI